MKIGGQVSGANVAAESWLISPCINLSNATQPQLTFDHAHRCRHTSQRTHAMDFDRLHHGCAIHCHMGATHYSTIQHQHELEFCIVECHRPKQLQRQKHLFGMEIYQQHDSRSHLGSEECCRCRKKRSDSNFRSPNERHHCHWFARRD